MAVYRGDEQDKPGSSPLSRDRPGATDDEEDMLTAFFNLMDLRSNDWITIADVDLYLKHFTVPYREWFPRLILGMQRAYHAAKSEADQRRSRRNTTLQESIEKK